MRKPNVQRLWALALTIGLILASAPDVVLEIMHSVEKHGPVLGVIAGFFYIRKEWQRHKFKARDKVWFEMFHAIGEAVGAKWNADTLKAIEKSLAANNRTFSRSFWLVGFHARSAVQKEIPLSTYSNMRRKPSMLQALTSSISKKLAAFVIAAGVTALNHRFNLDLNADSLYGIYALTIAYILGQSHVDAKKAISNAVNAAAGAIQSASITTTGEPISTITTPPISYREMTPYIEYVHKEINRLYEQLKTGKFTDSTQEAINVYMTLHDYFTKKDQAKGA